MATQRELSRKEWMGDNTVEKVDSGSLQRIAELETLLREVLEKHDAELADAKAHFEDESEFADGIVTCGEIAALRFDALVSEWGELAERIRKQVGKP